VYDCTCPTCGWKIEDVIPVDHEHLNETKKDEKTMDTFVAIDFETANSQRVSACSIGYVIVRNGEISESGHHLIKPIGGHEDFYTSIHKIKEKDTHDKPSFAELLQTLPKIFELPIVSYGDFDRQVLEALNEYYGLGLQDLVYTDACALAKYNLPDLPNYRLSTVAQHLGLENFTHHNALDDAKACATIYLKINKTLPIQKHEPARYNTRSPVKYTSEHKVIKPDDAEYLCGWINSLDDKDYLPSIIRMLKQVIKKWPHEEDIILDITFSFKKTKYPLEQKWFSKEAIDKKLPETTLDPKILEEFMTIPEQFKVPDNWSPSIPELPEMTYKELWEYRKQNPLQSISGAKICITGGSSLCYSIERVIKQHGGTILPTCNRFCDFLVSNSDYESGKMTSAKNHIAKGSHLRIINDEELSRLIKNARTFEQEPPTQHE